MIEQLELRQVLRSLRRAPMFTITASITLALGIGATAAIFSVVNAVLLRPLPYRDADRLVQLQHSLSGIGIPIAAQSLGTFQHYRRLSRTITSMGAYQTPSVNLSDPDGVAEPERVNAALISDDLLPTLGVMPARGRNFSDAEDQPNGPHVAILGDALWHRRFGGDPAILGKTIRVNGDAYQVIGVMPPSFHFPAQETDLWLPLQLDRTTTSAGSFSYGVVGRLAPGATVDEARAELTRLLARLPDSYSNVFPQIPMPSFLAQSRATPVVRTLRDATVGDVARMLWVVAVTAALVLVVTCANVANLLLVRAQGRTRELATRAALGASRGRLLGRFLAEGLVLATIGGVGGLALAEAATRLLVRAGPATFPRLHEIGLDAESVVFTMLVVLVVAVACSVLPALRYRAVRFGTMLREGGRSGTAGRERNRAQRALIVAQVALALLLLAGSGLLTRTVWRIRAVRPGFDASHALVFSLALPPAQFPHAVDVARFYDRVVQRMRELPGVTDAGAVSKLPLVGGASLAPVYVENMPVEKDALPPVFPFPAASAGYFKALRIPLVAGRIFADADDPQAAHEVVVSRAFAEKFWNDASGQRAVGKRVRIAGPNWSTIVGVVESVRDTSLEAAGMAEVYTALSVPATPVPDSLAPFSPRTMTVVLRAAGDPSALGSTVRNEIRALDPTVPVYELQPMSEIVARSTARTSFVLIALGAAAVITLVLGAVGLYGVIAYVVSLRTRELGLRIALGAQPASVRTLVLREGLRLALTGVAVGLVAFVALSRFLRALLFEVSPNDPLTLAAVTVALLVVAALASWLPAHRASRIDPLEALRTD